MNVHVHFDSGARCLVAHYDTDGNPLPPCWQCGICYEWVAPQKKGKE